MNPPLLPPPNPRLLPHRRQTLLILDDDPLPAQQIPSAAREKCVLLFRQLLQAVVLESKPQNGGNADER
jgi:hypothetical protein